jgi:hypothetical protein
LVGGKTVKKIKKTVKKFLIFFTVFPIDQSEAELQIVSRVSSHDVICCRFLSVREIECILLKETIEKPI